MTYGGDRLFGQARYGTGFADEPGVPPHAMNRKENFFVAAPTSASVRSGARSSSPHGHMTDNRRVVS